MHKTFDNFYLHHFLAEHRHPANVALHVAGALASAVMVLWAIAAGQPAWIVAFPLVHVLPGLLGHRVFERSAAVGDLRVGRRDFPLWWFIAGNYRLCFELVARRRFPR
jgi:hypothetical protein